MPSNQKRRDAARRHLERQLQRRQEQQRARRRTALIISVIGTVVLVAIVAVFVVAVGNDSKKTPAGAGASTPTARPASTGSCAFTRTADAARKVGPPPAHVPTTGIVTVDVKTNVGDLTFRLNRNKAPCTVASFASLVTQKFYDDTPCHRLTTSNIFVLQCGDPSGSGRGGPGYAIPDEYVGTETYTTGVLAMANTGQPNSGGSQFFIVYGNTPLPAKYTVFGTVTKGISVVQKIAAKGSNNSNQKGDGKPLLKTRLTKLTIVQ